MKNLLFIIFTLICSGSMQAQPNISWQKTYGGSASDYASNVQQTNDGGYIMAGAIYSSDGEVNDYFGFYDCWVVKTDSMGAIEWQKTYGGADTDEEVGDIQQTMDGGYIIAGGRKDFLGSNAKLWVLKLDQNGAMEWEKILGGSFAEYYGGLAQSNDGGYIILGAAGSNDGDVSGNHGGYDFWAVKLDDLGEIAWTKCLGGAKDDLPYGITNTNDDGYMLVGTTQSNNGDVPQGGHGSADTWVVKINDGGDIQWQKTFGGSKSERGNAAFQTSDNGYIVLGSTNSVDGDITINQGNNDAWILKLDINGALQWQITVGGAHRESAVDLCQASDGNYLIGGSTSSQNGSFAQTHGFSDLWLMKINLNGNILWKKDIGGSGEDYFRSIKNTQDGGFILAGYTESPDGDVTHNFGLYDCWLIKIAP